MSKCCENSQCQSALSPDSMPTTEAAGSAPLREGNTVRTRVRIEQMDCPVEEKLLRDKLTGMAGVSALEFNLMQRILTVTHLPPVQNSLMDAIKSLGFKPEILRESTPITKPSAPAPIGWPLILSGIAAMAAEVIHFTEALPHWVVGALALVAIAAGGLSTYKKGWIALKNRNLNINALMSIAVTGAMLIGEWPEAAMVMFLFAVAEVIEARSLDRARNAIHGLMSLAPDRATVLQPDGGWQVVDVVRVAMGARVRVRPGERIGLDGEVVTGQSTIDQSAITGESLPVEKAPGDKVFAGTLNQAGALEYRVTAQADRSTLARIIHAVEQAQSARAPTQRFVDQFARIYTPVVFGLALMVAVIPPLVVGGTFLEWIYRALVLLVVACPCALVISTPVTIVSGLALAARYGILVKGGVHLEMGRQLQCIALDKTGTLTHGKPEQTDVIAWASGEAANYRQLACSLAVRSDHPVSQAIARANGDVQTLDVVAFGASAGRGVHGEIDGKRYHLGNHRWVEELGFCNAALEQQLQQLEQQGKTVVILADDQQVLALFAVADTVKDSSREAIADLHKLGVKTLMLSGDNASTAQVIARQVGIDEVHANLLPEEKLRLIEARIQQGEHVGMVGDGINDAPSLARANIGFAMGGAGTDTAIETADVALMDDDLRKVPAFIRLSHQTATLLRQNIALAIGIKLVFLVMTLAGTATLWMAVFADMGASLLVVGNGLRLLRFAPDRR